MLREELTDGSSDVAFVDLAGDLFARRRIDSTEIRKRNAALLQIIFTDLAGVFRLFVYDDQNLIGGLRVERAGGQRQHQKADSQTPL